MCLRLAALASSFESHVKQLSAEADFCFRSADNRQNGAQVRTDRVHARR